MAKIETTFIRPQEVFDVDSKKSKVVYNGYENNPHELELKENLDNDVKAEINEEFVPNDNNNLVFTDSENTEHELITAEGFGDALNEALPTALANAQVIKTTWAELKDLRDNGNLIAGSLYRITDYNCTTTQENTRSAGHQFDIVLLALSENKLAEEGWAMMNENDVYDVTFGDGVTKKCWIYNVQPEEEYPSYNIVDYNTLLGLDGNSADDITFNEENKTATTDVPSTNLEYSNTPYNYFQNSNLSAWKVWYCLDNDTARFAWADDSIDEGSPASIMENTSVATYTRNLQNDTEDENVQYYAWEDTGNNTIVYTTSETPQIGDNIYIMIKGHVVDSITMKVSQFTPAHEGTGLPNGRGVIYRLIDEFNNDVAYDFKNIQFIRPLTDGYYNAQGTDTWVYTLNAYDEYNYPNVQFDASIIVKTWGNYAGYGFVNNNYINNYPSINSRAFALPDVVAQTFAQDDGTYGGTTGNKIDTSRNITLLGTVNIKIQRSRTIFIGLDVCNVCIENVTNLTIEEGCGNIRYYYTNTSNNKTIVSSNVMYINDKKVLTET